MINNSYLGSNGKCYGSIAEMEKDTGIKTQYYSLIDDTKVYSGIIFYPTNAITIGPLSGCWATSWPTNPSGGIWWDSKCGVQGHGKHSSDVIKEIPQTGPKKCDCKIMDLMTYGCRCKGI